MAKSNSTPSPVNIEKMELLLSESAGVADTIRNLAAQIVNKDGTLHGKTESIYLADAIFHLAEKAGWIADHGLEVLSGNRGRKGEAENWLLGPRYQALSEGVSNG